MYAKYIVSMGFVPEVKYLVSCNNTKHVLQSGKL